VVGSPIPSDLDPVVPAPNAVDRTATAAGGRPPAEPRTFALLDVLDPLPLAPPLATARQFLDRMANIRVDDEGIVLTGVWPRRVGWDRVASIEVCSRLDGLLSLGLGFTPLGRIPTVVDKVEETLVGALERVAAAPLDWAREQVGWTVICIHQRDRTTELRRLPALVARFYPAATRTIVAAAEARGIEITRRDC
jgi:hypothetical protein